MDLTSLGIAAVAAITVICYLVGLVALYTGLPDFPAADPLTAAAVGIVSGLAATGVNQVYKQLGRGGKE